MKAARFQADGKAGKRPGNVFRLRRFYRRRAVCSSLRNDFSENNSTESPSLQATRGRIVKTSTRLAVAVLVVNMLAGHRVPAVGDGRQSRGYGLHRIVNSCRDGLMHGRLLLPEADALSGLSSLRRHLRALLLQADALPELSSLRRDLRALLLQADALSLHAHRAARYL